MELSDLVQIILTVGTVFFLLGLIMSAPVKKLLRILKVYLGSPKYLQAEKPFKPRHESPRN